MSRLQRATPYVILLAAVATLFHRLLLGEVIFWGLPLLQFYPWRTMAFAALRTGRLPLWNPLLGNGAPLLANYQSAVFYPPNWLYLIIPAEYAMGLVGILHLLWAALGMMAYLRRLGVDRLGQGVGAIGFALSGYLIARFGFLTIISAAAWLPWLLWALEGLVPLSTRREEDEVTQRYAVPSFAAVVAMLLLAGHAQMAFYGLLLTGAYGVWRLTTFPTSPRRVAGGLALMLGAGMLGVGLAAVQIAPTFELMRHSQRAEGVDYEAALSYSFWPWHLLTVIMPDFFGSPASGDYHGYGVYWEDAVYVGLLTLLLASYALWRWRRERHSPIPLWRIVPFYAASIPLIFTLALGWNTPIFPWLFEYVPTFNLFHAPARWTILIVFALCVLGGIGAHGWQIGPRGAAWGRRFIVGGAGLILSALAVSQALGAEIEPSTSRAVLRLGVGAVAMGVLMLGLWRAGRHPRWRAYGEALALALLAADLVSAHWGLNPTLPAAYYRQRTPLADRLPFGTRTLYLPADEYAAKFDIYLLLTDFRPSDRRHWDALRASLLPNLGMIDGVPSANNFDPLLVGHYAALLDEIEQLPEDRRLARLQQMNVGVLLRARPDGTVAVTPVEAPWPRAALADCAPQGEALTCERRNMGEVALIVDEPERVAVSVVTDRSAWLVLVDTDYPGWEATLDGQRVAIRRANGAFRAVEVPAGRHEVAFMYRPLSLRVGAAISGTALAVCIGLVSRASRRRPIR